MVEDHKKSESDDKSEENWRQREMELEISELYRRVKALEEEILALQRGDNTGFKHQNDGGWFD